MLINLQDIEIALRNYILPILIFFVLAFIVHRFSKPIAQRFQPLGDITLRNNPRRFERQQTLQALLSSAIIVGGYLLATIFSLSLFISAESLLWIVGLFSAAFGLGARPFISDILTGITFIFEDTFDVGDKIEIPASPKSVEGIVEAITLRVTQVRAVDGELYTMPNGEIRLVRNFSRGKFSATSVSLSVPTETFDTTLAHLERLNEKATELLPNLLEPWQVISKSGEMGENIELTILAKAFFGKGAELRTNLLALLQQELPIFNVQRTAGSDQDVIQQPDTPI